MSEIRPPFQATYETELLAVAEAYEAVAMAEKVLGSEGIIDFVRRIEWFRARILSEEIPQSTTNVRSGEHLEMFDNSNSIQPPPPFLFDTVGE